MPVTHQSKQMQRPAAQQLPVDLCAMREYTITRTEPVFSLLDFKLHYISREDVADLSKWQGEREPGYPVEPFEISDAVIAASDFCQAFMLRFNDQPLFRIEVWKASTHAVAERFVTRGDDYYVELTLPPSRLRKPDLYLPGLKTILFFFFLHPGVGRLVTSIAEMDAATKALLKEAGFGLGKHGFKHGDLVFCFQD